MTVIEVKPHRNGKFSKHPASSLSSRNKIRQSIMRSSAKFGAVSGHAGSIPVARSVRSRSLHAPALEGISIDRNEQSIGYWLLVNKRVFMKKLCGISTK